MEHWGRPSEVWIRNPRPRTIAGRDSGLREGKEGKEVAHPRGHARRRSSRAKEREEEAAGQERSENAAGGKEKGCSEEDSSFAGQECGEEEGSDAEVRR